MKDPKCIKTEFPFESYLDQFTYLLPYMSEVLNPTGEPASETRHVADYLREEAETKDDRVCHDMLVWVAVHCLRELVTEQSRKENGLVDFEEKACLYLVELLQKIVQNEEPNKVFKWAKTGAGPRRTPDFIPLMAVAIPETRRRTKQVQIRDALAAKNISRRERANLERAAAEIQVPRYLKPGRSETCGEDDFYSQRAIENIMKKHGDTAQQILALERKLSTLDRDDSDSTVQTTSV